MITVSIAPAAAGLVAGGVIVLIDRIFGDELEAAEGQAIGIAAIGLGLTISEPVENFWTVAAVAGVPVVLNWWARRKAQRADQLARRARTTAEIDHRGGLATTAFTTGRSAN